MGCMLRHEINISAYICLWFEVCEFDSFKDIDIYYFESY